MIPHDERPSDPPGQRDDFTLANDDYTAIISLTYIDVSSGDAKNHTAEDYLNITRRQLADSTKRKYTFSENLESATIAGREYLVMHTTYVNNETPEEVIYQDGYAHRFVNTMIVFITVYTYDTKDSVDLFLSSIKPL